jgi:hypothetical protein
MTDTADTKEETQINTVYVIPRPKKGNYISVDIDTKDKFEIVASKCFRTMNKNNMCLCFTNSKINFYLDGYLKKGDDIYISLLIDNNLEDDNKNINLKKILEGKPTSNIYFLNGKPLEIEEISGNWISNIYDDKTEFIFNFTVSNDIILYKLTINFELPYLDGIHTDNPITMPKKLNIHNIKYNITQYSLTN